MGVGFVLLHKLAKPAESTRPFPLLKRHFCSCSSMIIPASTSVEPSTVVVDNTSNGFGLVKSPSGTANGNTSKAPKEPDNLSTTAIHKPDERILKKRSRHTPQQRNQAIQDSPKEVASILRSPSSRRNCSHRRRTSSLSNSILTSSILSPVFDYFSTASLVSSSREKASNQKSVRFSRPDEEVDDEPRFAVDVDVDAAPCRLSFLFGDVDNTPKKTHRRTHARMCTNDLIFGLDINDFRFLSNDEEIFIPTMIVFKTPNHDINRGQHSQADPPKRPKDNMLHHRRRSREYSFTV